MPFLQQQRAMLRDDRSDPRQFVRPETARPSKLDRLKPVLGKILRLFNVDVGRLMPLVAEEEEAVSINSERRRHCRQSPKGIDTGFATPLS
jgi:hypothetical protein